MVELKEKKEEYKRNFKGIWLDASIWVLDDISATQKILLAEIDSLDASNGCFARNTYFQKFLGKRKLNKKTGLVEFKEMSRQQVSGLISELIEKKYLLVERTLIKTKTGAYEDRLLTLNKKLLLADNLPAFLLSQKTKFKVRLQLQYDKYFVFTDSKGSQKYKATYFLILETMSQAFLDATRGVFKFKNKRYNEKELSLIFANLTGFDIQQLTNTITNRDLKELATISNYPLYILGAIFNKQTLS